MGKEYTYTMSYLRGTELAVDKKAIRKDYFQYLFPTIVGQVAHSLYCLVNVFFVGYAQGSHGLAVVNVALPIFTIYTTISILVGVGAATTISISRGEGKYDTSDRIFSLAFWLVVAIGLLFTIFGTIFIKQVAYGLGATPKIVDDVAKYILPINLGAVFYMLSSMLLVIVRSDGNPKLVMIACTVGNICNIILDFTFIIWLRWGVFGAGLATILGPTIALVILSLHFVMKYNNVHFTKHLISPRLLIRIFKNGMGSGVLEITSGFVIFFFNNVLIRVGGESAVAIFSIISNIAYVLKGIFNGMAQAAQPMVSESYGAKKYGNMREVNRYAILTAIGFTLALYAVICIFPHNIIGIFVKEKQIIDMGAPAIVLYFLSMPFTALNTILMYYFQSIEHVRSTIIISIMRGVGLVSISLFVLPTVFGINGVWISLFVAEFITSIVFFPIMRRMNRRYLARMVVPQNQNRVEQIKA